MHLYIVHTSRGNEEESVWLIDDDFLQEYDLDPESAYDSEAYRNGAVKRALQPELCLPWDVIEGVYRCSVLGEAHRLPIGHELKRV